MVNVQVLTKCTGIACALLLTALLCASAAATPDSPQQESAPQVTIHTDFGEIVIELNTKAAPKTCENFLAYCKSYFYDGLIFHRVVDDFVIQTGGYWFDLSPKEPTRDPILNESLNGLLNQRGTVAMARHKDPDSARAQFFINLQDNPHLDPKGEKPGYTVFGRVIKGLEFADAIGEVPTHEATDSLTNVPVEPVQINFVSVKK